MAFLTMSMYSNVLQMDTNVNVLLPENRRGGMNPLEPDRKYPVLYCLHGHGDDHTAWIRKSNIELIAREYDVVVVMPTTQRGFYVDNYHGLDYYTYFSRELPIKIQNFFPVSDRRKDTFIMGNSMGGYGALRIAMANPDKFAGAASLSGAGTSSVADDEEMQFMGEDFLKVRRDVFGPDEVYWESDNDLRNLVRKLNAYTGPQPKLYHCCGIGDTLVYGQYRAFADYVAEHGKNLDYISSEGDGGHNWEFWNPQIQVVFDLFGFERTTKRSGN